MNKSKKENDAYFQGRKDELRSLERIVKKFGPITLTSDRIARLIKKSNDVHMKVTAHYETSSPE